MEIPQDIVPSTIHQAVQTVVESLSDKDRHDIRNTDPVSVHHTVGRFLRNSWSFWDNDSPLKRDAVSTYSIAHADDISGLIIEWVYAAVQGKDFDPVKYCEVFHKHWSQFNMASLQAGGWKDEE